MVLEDRIDHYKVKEWKEVGSRSKREKIRRCSWLISILIIRV